MCMSRFRVDKRSRGLGGETRTESGEKRCLERTKEDFREAMRIKQVVVVFATTRYFSTAGANLLGLAHKAITIAGCGLKRPAQAWTTVGNSPILELE